MEHFSSYNILFNFPHYFIIFTREGFTSYSRVLLKEDIVSGIIITIVVIIIIGFFFTKLVGVWKRY